MSFKFLFKCFQSACISYIYWEFVPFSYETHPEGSVVSSRLRLGHLEVRGSYPGSEKLEVSSNRIPKKPIN